MYTYWLIQTLAAFISWTLPVRGFTGRCPTGWTYFEEHCYRLGRPALSFVAAQTNCESVGASLASITSAEENRFVADLGRLAKTSFHIGLNDFESTEGTFRWTDGTPFRYNGPSYSFRCDRDQHVGKRSSFSYPPPMEYCKRNELDYSNWMPYEPNNGDCVHIVYYKNPSTYGRWNDGHCSQEKLFMCKKGASEEGTVEETIIKCPHSFETFIELGTSTKSVSWSESNYLTHSLAAHVQKSHSPGVALPKGVTLVKYTFRDAYNHSATCNFSISVIEVDTTPPSIQGCPEDVTLVQQPGVPISVDWILPTASDLSGNVTLLSLSHKPRAIFDLGVHSVNYTFADSEGNEAVCLFTISVFSERAAYFKEKEIPMENGKNFSEIPQSDPRIDPDSRSDLSYNQSLSGLHSLISGLYFIIIFFGLSLAIISFLVIRNRNTCKNQSPGNSKSYSKMDEEDQGNLDAEV